MFEIDTHHDPEYLEDVTEFAIALQALIEEDGYKPDPIRAGRVVVLAHASIESIVETS